MTKKNSLDLQTFKMGFAHPRNHASCFDLLVQIDGNRDVMLAAHEACDKEWQGRVAIMTVSDLRQVGLTFLALADLWEGQENVPG